MSEPRRWFIHYDTEPIIVSADSIGKDHESLDVVRDPLNKYIEVVEAEPVLARIKQLEAQLKEANEALSWYADEKNWMTTRKDELHEARMTIVQDPDSFGVYSEPGLASTLLLIGGKRARAYLKKWEGKS